MSGESIQHFIDSGDTYTVHCQACHHHAPVDMLKLRDRLGPDHGCLHDDIIRFFVCSKCGTKRKLRLIRSSKGNEKRGAGRSHRNLNAAPVRARPWPLGRTAYRSVLLTWRTVLGVGSIVTASKRSSSMRSRAKSGGEVR